MNRVQPDPAQAMQGSPDSEQDKMQGDPDRQCKEVQGLRQRAGQGQLGERRQHVVEQRSENGLQLLNQFKNLDTFLVKQQVETFEVITGIETENKYQVLGAKGGSPQFGPVMALEKSSFMWRCLCKNRRPWTIRLDEAPHGLILERPFRWTMQEVRVYAGSEKQYLGMVKRSCAGFPFQRNFSLTDASGEPVLQIYSPFFSFGWNFDLQDLDGTSLGKIKKEWAGVMQELFTDADNFGVSFPERLPPSVKALVLASVFLIDFCFFEDNDANSNRNKGRNRR